MDRGRPGANGALQSVSLGVRMDIGKVTYSDADLEEAGDLRVFLSALIVRRSFDFSLVKTDR